MFSSDLARTQYPESRTWHGSSSLGREIYNIMYPRGLLLIPFLLFAEGLLREPFLYLSLYFKERRAEYCDLLNRVRIEGDCERWIAFFADGVCEMAENAAGAARELFGVAGEDRARIQTLGRVSGSSMQVHHALQRRPVGTISRLAKETGLSLPTVTKALLALERAGLVKEISGRRRNRVFVYSRYLDILVKGTGLEKTSNRTG
jgi:Fic family protein